MKITAEHLRCKYNWTEYSENDPKITGEPDGIKLNKAEGNEILAFMNAYLKNHEIEVNIDNIVRLECIIKEYLPSFCMTRKTIDLWISQHWDDWN